MNCPLCGLSFDETKLACHPSCVLHEACNVICCPGCGYQMVDTSRSKLAGSLRRLFRCGHHTPAAPQQRRCSLTDMRAGQSGTVAAVGSDSEDVRERLMILGVMPGAAFTLVQRRPAFVVRVGLTELSLEHNVAAAIGVNAPA